METQVVESSELGPALALGQPDSYKRYLATYFDSVAEESIAWQQQAKYYRRRLISHLQFLIPPGASVLEIGCGNGEVLNALRPARGAGIDISGHMVKLAQKQFPQLEFSVDDLEDLQLEEKFDYVLLMGLIGYVGDIQKALAKLHKVCRRDTRVVIVYFNYLWEPLLKLAERLRLRMKQPQLHWLPLGDIENLLYLTGFETIKKDYHTLLPIYLPFISALANRIIANLPFLGKLCVDQIVVARPQPPGHSAGGCSCSVIVPCRNEQGNIERVVQRIPPLGDRTEIIFVEGGSTDGTLEECFRVKQAYAHKNIRILRQGGRGKGDAVRRGFAAATGEVLMVLDADLTVDPEELPKFFAALTEGKGELVNGSRLVYQMENQAMRVLNLIGNQFFSKAFSYLLEQRLRDTLCGTKALYKKDYERIAAGRSYFGDFDPFGDFDLLFGAAKLNLKIVEIPVRYRARIYGTTNISRFAHGWLLLKMVCFATHKIKFI